MFAKTSAARAFAPLTMLLLAGSCLADIPSNVLVVNASAPAGGDGRSWETAYQKISNAISAMNASAGVKNELWIAAGSYTDFISLSGTQKVFGGFAGNETIRDQRDRSRTTIANAKVTMADDTLIDGMQLSLPGGNSLSTDALKMTGRARVAYCQLFTACTCDGGIPIVASDNTVFDRCLIRGMTSSDFGASMIMNLRGSVQVLGCTITAYPSWGSTGNGDGAVRAGGAVFRDCRFLSIESVSGAGIVLSGGTAINCVFAGNKTTRTGSEADLIRGSTLINCLIINNVVGSYGGVTPTCTVINCIIWGNTRMPPGGGTVFRPMTQNATYSTVQDWTPDYVGIGSDGLDPMLDSDGHLTVGSPAIDTGNTAGVPAGVHSDLDGKPRFLGPNTPAGSRRVDRGPFEFGDAPVPFCYANIDNSMDAPRLTVADFVEFLRLVREGHPMANCTGVTGVSSIPPPSQFDCFLKAFRAGCP